MSTMIYALAKRNMSIEQMSTGLIWLTPVNYGNIVVKILKEIVYINVNTMGVKF